MIALPLPHPPAIWLDPSQFGNNKPGVISEPWVGFVIPGASSLLNRRGLRSRLAPRSYRWLPDLKREVPRESLLLRSHQTGSLPHLSQKPSPACLTDVLGQAPNPLWMCWEQPWGGCGAFAHGWAGAWPTAGVRGLLRPQGTLWCPWLQAGPGRFAAPAWSQLWAGSPCWGLCSGSTRRWHTCTRCSSLGSQVSTGTACVTLEHTGLCPAQLCCLSPPLPSPFLGGRDSVCLAP